MFQSLADTNVGIVNEYILNTKGIVQGFGQSVNNFLDPTGGLPMAPDDGDRYISLATANGWLVNYLEIYDAKTDTWNNIAPVSGTIAWVDGVAAPNLRMWDPTLAMWVSIATAGGGILAVPSTDNAIVRFDGVAGQVQDSGILITDTNDIVGVQDLQVLGDTTIGGKLTVVGLIDPTGLELTPVAANPGGVTANTIWQDTGNGNRFTAGTNPLVLGPIAAFPPNTLASFMNDTTLQATPATIDALGNVTGLQNVEILGNVSIGGTIMSSATENINISDQYLQLNVGYIGAGQSSGLAMNYAGTGISTTTNGAFTPAIAAVSDATIATTAAGPLWVAGDLIQISGTISNNGFYEVQSHAGEILSLRGVGITPASVDFVQTQVSAETIVGAIITGVNIASLRTSSTGVLEYATGADSSAVVYRPVFESSTYTYTSDTVTVVPSGVSTCRVSMWAGGGCGGSAAPATDGGGGGGSSAAINNYINNVTPGATILFIVGAGGQPSAYNDPSNSIVSHGTGLNAWQIIAYPGGNGNTAGSLASNEGNGGGGGGAGGAASLPSFIAIINGGIPSAKFPIIGPGGGNGGIGVTVSIPDPGTISGISVSGSGGGNGSQDGAPGMGGVGGISLTGNGGGGAGGPGGCGGASGSLIVAPQSALPGSGSGGGGVCSGAVGAFAIPGSGGSGKIVITYF